MGCNLIAKGTFYSLKLKKPIYLHIVIEWQVGETTPNESVFS